MRDIKRVSNSYYGIAHLLLIILLAIAIPVTIYLTTQTQIFRSRANENGQIRAIDNLRRPLPDNKANTLFVYLEVDLPSWNSQDNSISEGLVPTINKVHAANVNPNSVGKEYTTSFRVSHDLSKLTSDTSCEITGDPETNCKEVQVINPSENYFVSWTLPKKKEQTYIFVRFFSNEGKTQTANTAVIYNPPAEIGWEVPTIAIGGQALVTTLVDGLRKLPGTAAFNAAAELLYRVHTAGEQIVTLSHAQQLGLNMDLIKNFADEVEFRYDQDELDKLDMFIEFFPEPDPVTGEARIQINPTANPNAQQENLEASLNITLGEVGGRGVGGLIQKGLTRVLEKPGLKRIIINAPRRLGDTLGDVSQWSKSFLVNKTLRPVMSSTNQKTLYFLEDYINPVLDSGYSYAVEPKYSGEIMQEIVHFIENYNDGEIRRLLQNWNRNAIKETLDKNWVIVVDSKKYQEIFGDNSHGLAFDGVLVMNSKDLADPDVFMDTLAHEMFHIMGGYVRGFSKIGKTFDFSQTQQSTYGRVLSQMYEVSTDIAVEEAFPNSLTSYKNTYPMLYASMMNLMEYISNRTGGSLTRSDYIAFALSGDEEQLLGKILEHISLEEFIDIIQNRIDVRRLNNMIDDQHTRRLNALSSVGLTGDYVFFSEYLSGQKEVNHDTTLLFEFSGYLEDADIWKPE